MGGGVKVNYQVVYKIQVAEAKNVSFHYQAHSCQLSYTNLAKFGNTI